MNDVFGTETIRERVLAGWVASAARFREDANAEEDFALGGYRDRVVIELAQNAADAATRAGVPGRVRFSLRDRVGLPDGAADGWASDARGPATLVVANTGVPLTAAGVESLATLRASAKRPDDGAVGRFGVGFAAVLAVTDEPVVLSGTGGVRFSRADSAAMVADTPALEEELRRRDGHVPALRLPFPADGEPPEGYDTAVLLPLRDGSAVELVRRLLDEADDALLLALPGLERIEIDVDGNERVLADATARWHVHRAGGVFGPGERERLLSDRPTEERARPYWSVLWALPRDPSTELPRVVHAPTPTDEPLSLPALLVATFPLDPTRRHVASGPLTERLVAETAKAYAELLHDRAVSGADVLPLVPTGLAAGVLDAALREAVLAALAGTPLLRAVATATLVPPRDAVVVEGIDDAFEGVLAPMVGGLVNGRQDRGVLDALGVRRVELADLVDQLGAVATDRAPRWWREVYAAAWGMARDPLTRESLGALPVPLADGRLVRGARGLLLPGNDLPADVLSTFGEYGARVVHPDAVHETLERLGATPTNPAALLADPAVRTAVEHSAEADDSVADAVLTVLAAAPIDAVGNLWWLADLMLRDVDGEMVPAHALVLPDSDAEALFDPDEVAPIDPALVERHGTAVLEAVGVRRSLRTATASDVALDALPEEFADLDGIEEWAAEVGPDGATVGELTAVRDLDWVADHAWPRALAMIGSEPALRAALVRPAASYTSWWLRRHLPLAGTADPDADPVLADLLDAAPDWAGRLDPEVRAAVGLVREVADLDDAGVELLLRRLAEPGRQIDAAAMLPLWAELGTLSSYPSRPPAQVRVLAGDGRTRVMAGDQAVVSDAPMWLQRADLGGHVVASGPAADGLCDLFDLPLASDQVPGKVDAEGNSAAVPPAVRQLVPAVPEVWWEHDELSVDGVEVSWWVAADGAPHASTVDGLAKALAWACGRWDRRHLVLTVLSEPDRATDLLIDAAFDSVPEDRRQAADRGTTPGH